MRTAIVTYREGADTDIVHEVITWTKTMDLLGGCGLGVLVASLLLLLPTASGMYI